MTETFTLVDPLALDDLSTYLTRAGREPDGSVRLIAGSGVLAAYVAIVKPMGLLDECPTVLGLRTFALLDAAHFDTVVPIRSLQERIARIRSSDPVPDHPVTVGVPFPVNTATWAAISPPRGGWRTLEPTEPALLEKVARAGIDEVAAAVPSGVGEQIVHRVRSEVWGQPIPGLEHVPAGAAFAAFSLGFLGTDGPVSIRETGPWTRLTTPGGHVLVKRKSWSLRG